MKERFLGVSVRKANPDTDSRVVPAPAHEHFLSSHPPANPALTSTSSRVQYMSDDELEVWSLILNQLIVFKSLKHAIYEDLSLGKQENT